MVFLRVEYKSIVHSYVLIWSDVYGDHMLFNPQGIHVTKKNNYLSHCLVRSQSSVEQIWTFHILKVKAPEK